jgi:hypothetical protein
MEASVMVISHRERTCEAAPNHNPPRRVCHPNMPRTVAEEH